MASFNLFPRTTGRTFCHVIRVSLSQVGAVHINCTGYLVSSVLREKSCTVKLSIMALAYFGLIFQHLNGIIILAVMMNL